MNTYAQGLRTQLRVIYAVVLRETRTRYGHHKAGYLWAVAEPLLFIVTFAILFYVADRPSPMGMELIPFLTTGMITYEVAMKTTDRVTQAVDANRALLFYPQVQVLDLAFARAVLELATNVLVCGLIIGSYALYTQSFRVDDILYVCFGWGLASLFGLTLGLVLCSLNVISNVTKRIKGPLFRPLFWISGLFFPANLVPMQYRDYLSWNPVLHCVEMVRSGWFRGYSSEIASPTYVAVCIVVLGFIGLTLERGVRARVELT